MPVTIGRCGGGAGGGTNIFYGRGQYVVPSVPSGTPKDLTDLTWQTSDSANLAFNTTHGVPNRVQLVSQAYVYVVTIVCDWGVLAGARTLQMALADPEVAYFSPVTVTTTDTVQILTGVIYLSISAPTTIIPTLAQSSGGSVVPNYVNIVAQASQWNT